MTTASPAQAEQDQIQEQQNLGPSYISSALSTLWEKAAASLTTNELEWFARFTGQAEREVATLSETIMGIGCLISSDDNTGNFQSKSDVSELLFNVSNQLDAIKGMIHIGNQSAGRLRYPDLYERIDALNGGTQ